MEKSIMVLSWPIIKLQIGQFDTKYWIAWKYKIKIALRGLGLLDVVEKDHTPSEDQHVEAKYNKEDSAALLIITSNFSDENLQKIMRFSTAREVWLELHRLFDGVSEDRAYDLCMMFFGYHKDPNDDVSTHLSKLKNIWQELSSEMKKTEDTTELPDMFLICKILDTLPERYFNKVKQCSKWIDDGRPPKPMSKTVHPKAAVNMNLMMAIDVTSVEIGQDNWYVDNGTASHVTNRQDLFETFHYFTELHTVTTANGQGIYAIGKGTIKVEADVGSLKRQITLNDVWLVPEITKNLFSVLSAQDRLSNSIFSSQATTGWRKSKDPISFSYNIFSKLKN